jgi:hypothetical protein
MTPLRIFTSVLLLFLGTFTAAPQSVTNQVKREWGQQTQGLALSIMTSNKNFSVEEPIALNISLKNVGKEDTVVPVALPLALYEIKIKLPNKQAALLTSYGTNAIDNAQEGSVAHHILKPGEETASVVSLDKIFDLSSKGKYTVSVTRRVRKNNEWTDLISNEIEIIVE